MNRDELSQPARALLELARGADDPSAADRARIDAAMSATLSAIGLGDNSAVPHGTPDNGVVTEGLSRAGMKLVLALAAVAGLWFGVRALTPEPWRTNEKHVAPQARPVTTRTSSGPNAQPGSDERASKSGDTDGVASGTAARPHKVAARVAPASNRTTSASAGEDTLAAELELIAAAEHAVTIGNFSSARDILARHAARFPDGALREERRGLHVLALCGLGKNEEARAEREGFLRDAPNSVLAGKVRAACVAKNAWERGPNQP